MLSFRSVLLLASATLLAGCANPGRSYAGRHPDLPAAHRQILLSGKIPGGTAVEGMTHEQVKIAMGGFPQTLDRVNNEEAWVYVRKKLVATELTTADYGPRDSGAGRRDPFMASDNTGPQTDVNEKTTVFFQGDRATHAQITEERP
jgi:hypothetical protein